MFVWRGFCFDCKTHSIVFFFSSHYINEPQKYYILFLCYRPPQPIWGMISTHIDMIAHVHGDKWNFRPGACLLAYLLVRSFVCCLWKWLKCVVLYCFDFCRHSNRSPIVFSALSDSSFFVFLKNFQLNFSIVVFHLRERKRIHSIHRMATCVAW